MRFMYRYRDGQYKGRCIVYSSYHGGFILAATPTLPTKLYGFSYPKLEEMEGMNIMEAKWIHPHLIKELKKEFGILK